LISLSAKRIRVLTIEAKRSGSRVTNAKFDAVSCAQISGRENAGGCKIFSLLLINSEKIAPVSKALARSNRFSKRLPTEFSTMHNALASPSEIEAAATEQ
jgi:hypothetical protein